MSKQPLRTAVTQAERLDSTSTAQQLRALRANLTGSADATLSLLRQAVDQEGMRITADDRIGEGDLAKLLGWTAASLANKRREGAAPPCFKLGGGGHRITYRLSEVAAWIEGHRE
ncbi:helix-turn-helix transcriptional regulator [Lysobacter enzymogenes]|uniref:helix-turn-helix transcriptional regulator n=1 Tax=Lysobacter enzymogenes TaxID=69 RepID=UPI0013042FAF|nr:hypothetical protein [Lysobacter enzymogenes]UZW60273.1 hypothetical protein BV903_023865 [Lysobacter enzymogenes]